MNNIKQVEKAIETLLSVGYSKEDILNMVKKNPPSMITNSIDEIKSVIENFGYTADKLEAMTDSTQLVAEQEKQETVRRSR